MATFASEEEVRKAISNPDTPKEIYNDIIAGNIQLEAPVEQTETPVTEEVQEAHEVQPIEVAETTNPVDELPDETASEQVARLLVVEKEKLRVELEEKYKTTQPVQPIQPVEVTPVAEPIKVEVDTEDSDLASSYEKGTREYLKQIVDQLPSAGVDAKTLKMINEIKQNQEKILGENEKAQERIRRENDVNSVCSKANEFIQKIPELKLPVDVREAFNQSATIRDQVAKTFGLTEEGDIEKATRGIIRGDSKNSKDMRDKLIAKGVEVPDYMNNYLDIVVMDETRNGVKFNNVTGKTEKLEFTFDEIYRMQNTSRVVTEQITNEVKNIADRLNGRDNSANSVLDVQITETTPVASATSQEGAERVLKYTMNQMKSDPKLAQEYVDVCTLINAKVPDQVKQILS